MAENGPTFQRWVRSHNKCKVPKGTTEAALLLIAGLCLSANAADAPPLLSQTIPLPGVNGRFDHFAMDAQRRLLFVAALGNDTLEVIDLAAGKRLQSVTGMSRPQGILSITDRGQILVANGDDGTLKVLDATDFKLKQNLPNLPDADNVRLDSHSGNAWVGYGDGALAEITPASANLTAAVKLPGHPESFQLEKNGPRIFVNVPDAKQIAVVDAAKKEIVAHWPMEKFQANFPMALDESHHRLFIGCRKPARLVIFDTEAGKSISDLPISGDTDDLFYDSKRSRVYISCGEGAIDVVAQNSADSYTPLAKVRSSPGARTCYFSPDFDRLYLAVPARGNQQAEIRVYNCH